MPTLTSAFCGPRLLWLAVVFFFLQVQGDQAGLVTEMLSFMQQVDFSVPAAFSAYVPAASEVARKARSFR